MVRVYHIVLAASASWRRMATILDSHGTVASRSSSPVERRKFLKYFHSGNMDLLLLEGNVEQLLSRPGR